MHAPSNALNRGRGRALTSLSLTNFGSPKPAARNTSRMVVLRAGRTAPPVEPVLSARRTPQHSCGLNRAATGIRISRLIAAGLSGGSPSTVDRGRLRSHTWHTAALHEVRVFTRERLRHLVCVPALRKHVGFVTISKLTVAQLTYLAEWSHASEAHWTEHLRATRRHSHIVGSWHVASRMRSHVGRRDGMAWLMLVVGLLTSYILIFVTRPLDGGLMAALPLSPGRDLFAHRRPMLWVVVAGWLGVGQGGGDRCSHLLVTCGRPVEAS